MLREVRDANGNTMRYHYQTVDGGAGAEPWRQIYLKSIRYTGTPTAEGPYEVVFNREASRPDAIVDGRAGFKTVLAERLASIDVRLLVPSTALIRRYTFSYTTGEFSKSLLSRITQLGQDGTTEFNHHSFTYFDEVASGAADTLNGFRPGPTITGATTIDGDGLLLGEHSTALGATDTTQDQGHFYAGIAKGYTKEQSIGAKVGLEQSTATTSLSLVDLDGDSLSDQVYLDGNTVVYRKNLGGTTFQFAAPTAVANLAGLGRDSTLTLTAGAELFYTVGAIRDKSWTRTTGEAYMTDVNGDMLPDLVLNGQVTFNRLTNGVPSFGPNSPTPMAAGANSDTSGMIPDPEAGRAELEAAYHLVDPVRAWVAPYDGKVAITGQVKLLTAAPAGYPADGVRASVQLNGAELWTTTIADPRDLTPKAIAGLGAVKVSAGDRLYFRVHSITDGAYDAVEFNPTVAYTGVDTARVDENGMPVFVFNAGSDYAYGGRPLPFTTPFGGAATLTGSLVKRAATTDDLTVQVLRNGALVFEQTVTADQTGTIPVQAQLTTTAQQQIEVRLVADSRIDLSGIRFSPKLVYQTVDGKPAPKDQSGASLLVFPPRCWRRSSRTGRPTPRPRRMRPGSPQPTASSTCTRPSLRPARSCPPTTTPT